MQRDCRWEYVCLSRGWGRVAERKIERERNQSQKYSGFLPDRQFQLQSYCVPMSCTLSATASLSQSKPHPRNESLRLLRVTYLLNHSFSLISMSTIQFCSTPSQHGILLFLLCDHIHSTLEDLFSWILRVISVQMTRSCMGLNIVFVHWVL